MSLSRFADKPDETRVCLNVGGQKHETYVSTLASIPDTRLAWVVECDMKDSRPLAQNREYFFDRNPAVFTHILNYYRTGKLHCPRDVCGPLFEEELSFWGIDEKQMEPCCWTGYEECRVLNKDMRGISLHRDIDQLSEDDELDSVMTSISVEPKQSFKWPLLKMKIWRTFENPFSSRAAQALGFISLILSVALVTQFCLKTLDYFEDDTSPQGRSLFAIEVASVSWFTLELVMRFSSCPRKISFLKTLHNWADLLSILPFYISLMTPRDSTIQSLKVLYVLRMSRTFRLLKFSYVVQVFKETLRASSRELYFLVFILSIQVIAYGSIAYYAERHVTGTLFTNIPAAIWWAIVTMTTVGYGDMSPSTTLGKIMGCACALNSVLMMALPVGVVASNFSLYNSYAQAKLNLPVKRQQPIRLFAPALIRQQANTSQKPSVDGSSHSPRPGSSSSIATEVRRTTQV